MVDRNTLQQYAKELRHHSTDAEMELWRYLRAKRLCGYKFRRQVCLGNFIVDFCCLSEKLIIELDGSQHADQQVYDRYRTECLEKMGFRVIRFWDNQALLHTKEVLQAIVMELDKNII